MNILTGSIVWLAFWTFANIFRMVVQSFDKHYFGHVQLVSLYSLAAAFGIVLYYKQLLFPAIKALTTFHLIVFLIVVSINLCLYAHTKRTIKRCPFNLPENRHSYLRLDYRYHLFCISELIFQQTMVMAGVLLLTSAGLKTGTVLIIFSVFFAAVHLPLLLVIDTFWALLFTISSFIAGIIFPLLILNLKDGFFYAFLIHYVFYTLVGVLSWRFSRFLKKIWKSKQK
ncbi:hypothetical protein JXA85_00280 [Candidatus Woesearchaeota archaeon]|nr:hypothetical protein [Candidatus Woesearchaeota archaeon]